MRSKNIKNKLVKQQKRKKRILITLISMLLFNIVILYFLFYPKIKIDNEYETINLNEQYKLDIPEVYRLWKKVNLNVDIKEEVDISKVGTYYIKYKVKSLIYNSVKTKKIIVVDNGFPDLKLIGKEKVTICPNTEYIEEGYTAFDSYDGDLTNKVKILNEGNKIIYFVYDSSGNTTTIERTITKEDNESPTITLLGNNTINLYVGDKYEEPGYTVNDNCYELDSEVKVTDNINTKKAGTYIKKYEVTDGNGNYSFVERKIIVRNRVENKGVVYLTFDDGPSNKYTGKILDILKKYNVKATFFVTSSGSDDLIKREFNDGHTVALHTSSHDYKKIYSSIDGYFEDLNKISNRVYKITGSRSTIIRFPGGSSNTVSKNYSKGIMTELTNEVVKRGYTYFDWNISSGDAGETTDPVVEYNNVIKNLKMDRANVILMHDIKKHTSECIENIILYCLENGYKLDKITNETKPVHHKVNN